MPFFLLCIHYRKVVKMENVSGVKLSDLLNYEVDKAKNKQDEKPGSIFSDMKDAFEENPNGISNDAFKQIFNDRFDLEESNDKKLDALTNYISSLDQNTENVTLQDIGTYYFATTIIEAAGSKDYSSENVEKIVSAINKNLEKGDVSVTDFANDIEKVIDTHMHHSIQSHIRGVLNLNNDNKFSAQDLEIYAESALSQYARQAEKELEKVGKTSPEVKEEEPKEETKAEEAKVEEDKAEEAKTEEDKAEEAKTEEAKVEEDKAEEAKTEEAKAEEAKVEEDKAEEVKEEETKPEEAKAEAPRTFDGYTEKDPVFQLLSFVKGVGTKNQDKA